jgi:ABC-type cobalt transport system substrate-binding protein
VKFAVTLCLLAACGSTAAGRAQQTAPPQGTQPYTPDTRSTPYSAPTLEPPASAAPPYRITVPPEYRPAYPVEYRDGQGSTYIPMDSWIYPALDRLHGLGYLDTAFLGLRPWTRLSVLHMLDLSENAVESADDSGAEEAQSIFLAVEKELSPDLYFRGEHAELDTTYSRFLGITDTPLNDSYHLGQTIINDYGRPFQAGINNISGLSGRAEAGRFTLFVRAEYEHSPSALGYSPLLGAYLSDTVDDIAYTSVPHQDTLPVGPIGSLNNFRVVEATVSYHLLNHEVSFGKQDHWWGPGKGGAFAWSTNANDIYAFQINRVEPLYIPWFDKIFGPIRYDFLVGSLQGHTQPNHPYVHAEKISIHPTKNLELGFERTVIWGGKGHEPVTLHTFLRSFFSTSAPDSAVKASNRDPGARFSAFDFNYRLPYLRNWVTLYTDSFAHDDVNPIDAPRRAAIRPGIYLSHVPGVPKLDLRAEAAYTDSPTSRSNLGQFYYYEGIQQQGTTNKGFLFTDPIGREDKGGQAWITYHLSPSDHIEVNYRRVKAAKDFIAGGTTQNEYGVDVVKTFGNDVEFHLAAQYEGWKAPIYRPGSNTDTAVWGGFTWYPHKGKQF